MPLLDQRCQDGQWPETPGKLGTRSESTFLTIRGKATRIGRAYPVPVKYKKASEPILRKTCLAIVIFQGGLIQTDPTNKSPPGNGHWRDRYGGE